MNKVWSQRITGLRMGLSTGLLLCGVMAGCAAPGNGAGSAVSSAIRDPAYTCEHGLSFTVKFADNTALLSGLRTPSGSSGARDQDLLLRDAGGQGAQQAFYSNPRMRAEFGLGASGREAILRYPLLPLVARCVRQ